MNFTDDNLQTIWFVFDHFINDRKRADRKYPPEVDALFDIIDAAFDTSADGSSESCCGTDDPTHLNWMETHQAAEILNHSERWIREIATQLGGEKHGGRWFFPTAAVLRYREGRHA